MDDCLISAIFCFDGDIRFTELQSCNDTVCTDFCDLSISGRKYDLLICRISRFDLIADLCILL